MQHDILINYKVGYTITWYYSHKRQEDQGINQTEKYRLTEGVFSLSLSFIFCLSVCMYLCLPFSVFRIIFNNSFFWQIINAFLLYSEKVTPLYGNNFFKKQMQLVRKNLQNILLKLFLCCIFQMAFIFLDQLLLFVLNN